ncbi:hypothetical protein NW762_007071 [Fusarium torreyae]|uniref:Uncharacterized protein n=1 Tax=Fusarium torreyae TaxID=1237075 RepID=A0A9W8VES8_9HYPO|nr:hypothetical protein NW762_007071 [Fusarium torreyae]
MLATEEQALEPGGGALLNYENSEWQITVPENGYLKLLAHSFGKTHVVCLAYLYVVTTEFTFRFVSPKSLAMFVDQVAKRLYFKGSPGVMMPTFRIVLDIFHPQAFPQGNEMEEWSHSDFFHGVLYGAQTHFMAWMRAVKRLRELPVKFKTEVHLLCPFRDYLTLSNQSGVLRAENIELNVSVEPETWAKVPERNFNMALTKFALTGKKMDDKWEQKRQNLSIKRISQLSRYGTVGVNRLRVKVPSQE